jgi:serine/threonine-protein kinase HipA
MKAQMAVQDGRLQLIDSGGEFIVKPSPEEYPFVAENEHATLTLMSKVGFPVPPCGLIKLKDGHLVFAIRRYDRDLDEGSKLHQEDAMQALGVSNVDPSYKYTAIKLCLRW